MTSLSTIRRHHDRRRHAEAYIVIALLALGQGVIRGCNQGTLPFGQQGGEK